jgi:VanZ family protein
VSRLATWLPPIVWMAVVLAMSSAEFSAENTGGFLRPLLTWLMPWLRAEHLGVIHGVVRKAAHLTEYAILGALWFRAVMRSGVARRGAAAWLALGISVVCAVVDEAHQSMVPSRTSSVGDVLVDSAGALLAIVPSALGWWRTADGTTSVLLWVAAAGGLAALAVDLAAGGGGGVLWLTVPAAAGLLFYRRRRSPSGG